MDRATWGGAGIRLERALPGIPQRLARIDPAWPALALILAGWAFYARVFIYLTSAVVGGVRYFLLFDDEMISMRYAANLAHGYGLVWNPHQPAVQGFTNPSWVGIMTLLHLLPVSAAKMPLLVELLCAALGLANLLLVWRLAKVVSRGSSAVALAAVALTACYFPLNQWTLRGTEVALLTPLLTLAVCLAIRTVEGASSRWLWAVLAFGALTRLDVTAPATVIVAMVAMADPARRREHLWYGLGTLVIVVGTQLLLSRWYFGSALPNTYYLKMTGYPLWWRLESGVVNSYAFLGEIGWLAIGLTLVFVALSREVRVLMPAALFAYQLAYSIEVGGDAWEWYGGANRYVAIAMPLFMILLATALAAAASTLVDLVASRADGAMLRWAKTGVFCLLFGGCFWTIISPDIPQFFAELNDRSTLDALPEQEEYVDHLAMALDMAQFTDREATVAVAWAGIIPYFADRDGVDLLGKNDSTIAHEPMRLDPALGFWPGHLKWDYQYSIGTLKPDVIAELWKHREEAQPEIAKAYELVPINGHIWYLRKDSRHVLWDRVDQMRDHRFGRMRSLPSRFN